MAKDWEKKMSTAIIKPAWSFITIALMVLGFIIFWPLGLAMLAYILWGEHFGGSSEEADRWIKKQKGNWKSKRKGRKFKRSYYNASSFNTGNAAFDKYREDQLRALDEERARLDEEINHFQDYMQNLRKARDREEFDRFMSERSDNQSEDYTTIDEDEVDYRPSRKGSRNGIKTRKGRKE